MSERDVTITHSVTIPFAELKWAFARSSGPGGQSVNTSDTKVTLTWDLEESAALSTFLKARARERLASTTITITVQRHRSQLRNREEAIEKLIPLVQAAIAPPQQKRRLTRPSKGAKEERLAGKKRRSEIKEGRRRPDAD
jgi:ribosome-associated protein